MGGLALVSLRVVGQAADIGSITNWVWLVLQKRKSRLWGREV